MGDYNETILRARQADLVVGVDPDIDRDGVAVLVRATGKIAVEEMEFGETLGKLQELNIYARSAERKLLVLIEAGWHNKGNYHLRPTDSRAIIARKGMDQGRNHQRGLDLVSWCQAQRIPYAEADPLPLTAGKVHFWSGRGGKITQVELERIMGRVRAHDKNGRECMLNQEGRDAALLAWWYAGLPLNKRERR